MNNHFVSPKAQYSRDLAFSHEHIQDVALALHKRYNQPIEECVEYAKQHYKKHSKVPSVKVLERNAVGDRVNQHITAIDFIQMIPQRGYIVSPTMTLYTPPTQQRSLLADFIEENIDRRKASKRAMFDATDPDERAYKNNEQQAFKIANNALSGAQSSKGTCLYNKTAHSSMTALCRLATSYANANNEKFLQGNRHYWSLDLVKENLFSIIRHADYPLLEEAIHRYGLVYPSIEQTLSMIERSICHYSSNPESDLASIQIFVETLTPLERAAFVYEGDLYHLAQYNDTVVRTFLDALSSKATQGSTHPDATMQDLDADLKSFVCLLCASELNGESLESVKETRPQDYAIIAATVEHVIATLNDYQWLIKALWRVNTLPASIAQFPTSFRKSVIASDTDSTIFTTEYWVEWFCGAITFDEKAKAISYTITYLTSQMIIHILAKVSAGMGVDPNHTHLLTMKNEFSYPVFVRMSIAKNYFAYISAQEGRVLKEYNLEVKGNNLKCSNVSVRIISKFNEMMREIMDQVIAHQSVDLESVIKRIVYLEQSIKQSIRSGETTYYERARINSSDAYKRKHRSPYFYYLFWTEVFADKYGDAPEPPYEAVKVPVKLNRIGKIRKWLAAIEDQALVEQFNACIHKYKKSVFGQLLLPRLCIVEHGIPQELVSVVDAQQTVYQSTKAFYYFLEALGIYRIKANQERTISELNHAEMEDRPGLDGPLEIQDQVTAYVQACFDERF